jgi:alpha-beta hydrolase superfamily lysophospholipase
MTWPIALFFFVVVIAALAFFALRPAGLAGLAAHPRPAASYDEAAQRVSALQAQEGEGCLAAGRTRLLTHGARTARAVVLVHGYTACVEQFVPLGQQFFDRGCNVLIARLPHHGRADRLTDEHGQLTAEELAAYADEVVDIAAGLGERVCMAGLSCGGVTTAWAAQNRADVDRALVISPAVGFRQVPRAVTVPLMNVVRLLPDAFAWWEPELKEKSGLPGSYPRYSRRALAETLRLGFATLRCAGQRPAAAASIVMVTNAHDDRVDNAAAARLVAAWRAGGTRNVSQYEFPAGLQVGHDLIDPQQPDARPEVVFPKLVELMLGPAA